jgi:DNA-binding MarR family transcriptional regulator
MEVTRNLSYEVHALTAKLDRAADRLLRERFGVSYRRFLTLYMVGDLGVTTQRGLARQLDVTEPSVSRMIGVLRRAGLLRADSAPGAGNRRQVALTDEGRRLLDAGQALLTERLDRVVARSGIPHAAFLEHARRLSAVLDEEG